MKSKKNIIITGSRGLLGNKIIEKLKNSGFHIYAISRSKKKRIDTEKYIEDLYIDFSKRWSENILPKNCYAILHLAQSSKFRKFPDTADDIFKVNIESTARLLDFAKKNRVKKFIYASSGGVYGDGSQIFRENQPIIPPGKLGYYLGSKACGEILTQSYASIFQVVVVRPFFIYGPGQNKEMLIPRLFNSVASNKIINIQGKNGIQINPIHVDDASSAVIATLNTKISTTFNIAGKDVLNIRKIAESMGFFLKKKPKFRKINGAPRDLVADISLMSKKLYKPKFSLLDSLNDIKI